MPVRQILAYRGAIWHLAALAKLGGNDLRSSRAPIEQIVACSLATDQHGTTIPFVLIDLIMSLMSRFQQPVTSTEPTICPCRHVPRFWNGPSPFDPVADPLVPSFPRSLVPSTPWRRRGAAGVTRRRLGPWLPPPGRCPSLQFNRGMRPTQSGRLSPLDPPCLLPPDPRVPLPLRRVGQQSTLLTWVRGESRGSWESRLKA